MNRLTIFLVVLISAGSALADPAVIRGPARVIDGDTLEINGQHVRLWGIDAFERGQTCGMIACGTAAATALWQVTYSRIVECTPKGARSYGRVVAVCRVGGRDLAEHLVALGWALDWPRYSGGVYKAAQDVAQADRVGAWSTTFTRPWEYRANERTR